MSEVKKPRGWEILYEAKRGGDEFIRGPATGLNEFVKVIEKSALDKAVEELKFVIKFCEKEGIYLTRSVDVLKELGVECE